MKPQIIVPDFGRHNADLQASAERLARQGSYKDHSTIIIIPALDAVPTKVVASWWNMLTPPNQKVFKLFTANMEVGAAYSSTIEMILANEELAKFKYILTMEHDNAPQADGLVKLLERIDAHSELSTIGGLYWTKGEGGVPQIWGNPKEALNFKPQAPVPGELVECCGTGMGFNLFRLDMFKDTRLRRPWFKTQCEIVPNKGAATYTQDLYFWEDARKYGYRCAIDCSVLVGHYDSQNDIMW
tara:strand:+ start:179 stop:904 length:726 start_codon:yes stop_codon:yes gene_type:complete